MYKDEHETTFQNRKIFKYKFSKAQVPVASLKRDKKSRKHQLNVQSGLSRTEKKDLTTQQGGCLKVSLRILN